MKLFHPSIQQQQMKAQTPVETEVCSILLPLHVPSKAMGCVGFHTWKRNIPRCKIRSVDVSRFSTGGFPPPTPSVGNNGQTIIEVVSLLGAFEGTDPEVERDHPATIRDLWLGGGELKEVSKNGKIRNSDG